jgi:hypothetical protein
MTLKVCQNSLIELGVYVSSSAFFCREEGSYFGRCLVGEARHRAPNADTEVLPFIRGLEKKTDDQEMEPFAEESK